MNLEPQHKRGDKMLADLEPQLPSHNDVTHALFPHLALFSEQERQALEQMLYAISKRVVHQYGSTGDLLQEATNEELDTLSGYFNLMEALEQNDQARAEQHRQALTK